MKYRKFLIPAPGGTETLTINNRRWDDVMSGKSSPRDALRDASSAIQQILDKWKR